MKTAVRIYYEGRVQGVGFRWTVKNLAQGFDVTGSVRNLPDGRVELDVAGEREEVEAFLEEIVESELKAHIRGVESVPGDPLAPRKGFQIAH